MSKLGIQILIDNKIIAIWNALDKSLRQTQYYRNYLNFEIITKVKRYNFSKSSISFIKTKLSICLIESQLSSFKF